jgi:hypothetical protein
MNGERVDGEVRALGVDAVNVHHGQNKNLARTLYVVCDSASN